MGNGWSSSSSTTSLLLLNPDEALYSIEESVGVEQRNEEYSASEYEDDAFPSNQAYIMKSYIHSHSKSLSKTESTESTFSIATASKPFSEYSDDDDDEQPLSPPPSLLDVDDQQQQVQKQQFFDSTPTFVQNSHLQRHKPRVSLCMFPTGLLFS